MEVILGILAFIVAVLAVLQGWQMRQAHRNRRNTSNSNSAVNDGLDNISSQLTTISNQLGRMEQRLNDIWDKVKS